MTRSPKLYRPEFDALEARLVLTTYSAEFNPVIYPFGTVGPLPTGSHRAASPVLQPWADGDEPPYGGWQSLAMTSIGGLVQAVIYPGGSDAFATVQWSLGGAGGGIDYASYTWTANSASFTRTNGVTHTFPAPGSVGQDDAWQWYWDEIPGTKTITITTTYQDGTQYVSTNSYNVTAPSGTAEVGLAKAAMTNSPPSALASASLTGAVNMNQQHGAKAGFIQLVTSMNAYNFFPSGNHGTKFNITSGAGAWDQPTTASTPYFNQYWVGSLMANAANNIGPTSDNPGAPMVQNNVASSGASYTANFSTYLDYQPPSGIHIELAEVTWLVDFNVSYTGPLNPTMAQYSDPNNWTFNYNNVQVTGSNSTIQLIQWSINVDTAKANGQF